MLTASPKVTIEKVEIKFGTERNKTCHQGDVITLKFVFHKEVRIRADWSLSNQ